MPSKLLNVDELYLMGRLYGAKGQPTSGYFPLPHETLALQDMKQQESATIVAGETMLEVTCEAPIAASDKHGRLSLLSEKQEDMLTLVRTPLSSSNTTKSTEKGRVLQKVLFFPSYLMPLSQIVKAGEEKSGGGDSPTGRGWMTDLYAFLKETAGRDNTVIDQFSVVGVPVKEACILPVNDKILLENSYFSDYQKWHKNYKNSTIHVLEVPQFYTVQVAFSTKDYVGATVTLRDLPISLAGLVVGDQENSDLNQPTSLVKEVSYNYFQQDENGSDQKDTGQYFVATFWIESAQALALHQLEEYARIDVNLETVDERGRKALRQLNLPEQYSLKEKVFDLPIHTSTGRTTVVSGDPISVEEALINHAPQFFTGITSTLTNQPYADVKQLNSLKPEGSVSLPEQSWQLLQTHKGSVDAALGCLENGLTWKSLAQALAAAVSALPGDSTNPESGGLVDIAQKATGITMASLGFIEKLNSANDSLQSIVDWSTSSVFQQVPPQMQVLTRLNDIFPSLNIQQFHNESLNPYLKKIGKAGNWILDKPLTIANAIYSLNSYSSNNSEKADDVLMGKIQAYSSSTVSLQQQQLKELQEENVTEKYHQAITALREKLNNLKNKEVLDHHSQQAQVGNTMLRFNATLFPFDSDRIKQTEHSKDIFKNIASELIKISKTPFKITVSGHTCNIGEQEYNIELSQRRAEAVKKAILDAIPSDPERQIWDKMFYIKAWGDSSPLPNNHNSTKQERQRNRRVEVIFHFDSMTDYPPCRAGLYDVEKAAKAKITSDIKNNEDLLAVIDSGIDILLLGAGVVFPVFTAWAQFGGAALSLANDALKFMERFDDENDIKRAIEQIRLNDIMAINAYFSDVENGSVFHAQMHAYMKRLSAFNGLIRLIKASEAFSEIYTFDRGITPRPSNNSKRLKEFSQLNILGYIDKYILSDDWDIETSLLGINHLDEVWMDANGYDESYQLLRPYSAEVVLAQGTAIFSGAFNNDITEKTLEKATKFNHYFPVHYRASKDEETFKSLQSTRVPEGLDTEIFKGVEVFVRRSYKDKTQPAPKKDDWIPFADYYKSNQEQLTPFDNVRVVVIFDDDKVDKYQSLPVKLDVMSYNTNEGDWKFFDSVASRHVEYSSQLMLSSFTEAEQTKLKDYFEVKGKSNEKIAHGVIIEPSYFFGKHRIFGIRPVANYNDRLLKSLFDSNKPSTSSGAHKILSYFLQLSILNQKNTEYD
ncbi:hypothetical protein C1141_14205, partial [Vibrio agarivorans]